jgi:hypothetical protein
MICLSLNKIGSSNQAHDEDYSTTPSPDFSGVRASRSLVFCVVFCRLLCLFSFGHCIVSILFQFTASDYRFGTSYAFREQIKNLVSIAVVKARLYKNNQRLMIYMWKTLA